MKWKATSRQILLFLANMVLMVVIWTSIYDETGLYIDSLVADLGEWSRWFIFGVSLILLTALNYNAFGDWCLAYSSATR